MSFRAIFLVFSTFSLSAGCGSSRSRAAVGAMAVNGGESVVMHAAPLIDIAARRAALIPLVRISPRENFVRIWFKAGGDWEGRDSPESASLQLGFKMYTCLLAVIDYPSKRTALIKDLRAYIACLALTCADGDVAVLEGVIAFVRAIETAVSVGGLYFAANLECIRICVKWQIESFDLAYSLRSSAERRSFVAAELRRLSEAL